MKCKNHSEEVAIERCSICGNWFCEDCVTVDNIKVSCNICLGKKIPNKKQTIISEVVEEPGTIQKPIEETSQINIVKTDPDGAQNKPEKIISNDETVDNTMKNKFINKKQDKELYYQIKDLNNDDPLEFEREVNKIMNQVVNRRHEIESYYRIKAKERGFWKVAVGVFIMGIGALVASVDLIMFGGFLIIMVLFDVISHIIYQ